MGASVFNPCVIGIARELARRGVVERENERFCVLRLRRVNMTRPNATRPSSGFSLGA
jgi:hypothetical protein